MKPTVLILGAGSGIGAHCISVFSAAGYNIVAASRSRKDGLKAPDHLNLHLDLGKPRTIPLLFRKIKDHFEHPNVVIYNGAAMTFVQPDDPLASLSEETIDHDMAVNLTSALIAGREAVKGWGNDHKDSNATFIYTGNKQNVIADPKALTFGMAKTAAAKMIWDCSFGYTERGYKFYFTDQRKSDGAAARDMMDPEARAQLYLELAQDAKQRPWHYTFVKETGYVDFRSIDQAWNVEMNLS